MESGGTEALEGEGKQSHEKFVILATWEGSRVNYKVHTLYY